MLTKAAFAVTISFFGVAASVNTASAWGRLGHEVVCEIAYQELTPTARQAVNQLIRTDDEYRTFAKSCTWPDDPRRRSREHFVNIPRDSLRFEDDPCPVARKCVVTAILSDMQTLAFSEGENDRLEALKFLGHWIGDVHQPIHVSFQDDKGGNAIDVGSPCYGSFHGMWDTCIIKETIGRDYQNIAELLLEQPSEADRNSWIDADVDQETVIGWAQESLDITLSPDVLYCVRKDGGCWYDDLRREYDGAEKKDVNAPTAYLMAHSQAVGSRLTMAGVRLGHVLNVLLGGDEMLGATSVSLSQVSQERSQRLGSYSGAHDSNREARIQVLESLLLEI